MSSETTTQETVEPTPDEQPGPHDGRLHNPIAQAVELQTLIRKKAKEPKLPPMALAALARAWSELEDRKRILRNRPLPGQLRPDLDPVQMAKALKRSKQRLIHDIGPSFAEPKEEPPPKAPSTTGEQPPPAG